MVVVEVPLKKLFARESLDTLRQIQSQDVTVEISENLKPGV